LEEFKIHNIARRTRVSVHGRGAIQSSRNNLATTFAFSPSVFPSFRSKGLPAILTMSAEEEDELPQDVEMEEEEDVSLRRGSRVGTFSLLFKIPSLCTKISLI
jgi:hypothetical protein